MEINLTAPTSWATLNEQQVVYVARVLSQQPTKEELLMRCLLKFTGLHPIPVTRLMRKMAARINRPIPFLCRYKRKEISLSAEQIHSFCRQLEYLTEAPGLMACPSRLAGLYSPDAQLWNVTFEAYLMADRNYRAYSQTKNAKFLYDMIGVLWRKQGVPYSDALVAKNARRIRRGANKDECDAVFLWFTGVKLWLKDKYPDLFSGEDTDTDTDESDKIMNMLHAVAEGKAHENKAVFQTPVHEILHSLNIKAKQINEFNTKHK